MQTVEEKIDSLNRLLRGELSAVETYEQVLGRVPEGPLATEVRRIAGEHRDAVNTLRQHIVDHNGIPATSSGAWGVWAQTVEGIAQIFGHRPALRALREGEDHGVKAYESALEDRELAPDCKRLIRSQLLPRSRAHLLILDGWLR